MSILTGIAKLLWLTEEDPSKLRIFFWRLLVSALLMLGALFVVWAIGGVYGTQGFAYADDVDMKITTAIAPINDTLEKIDRVQSTQSGYLERLVKSDLSRLIDNEVRARCSTTTREEKERIKAAIKSYQEDYKAVAEEEYDEPSCDEL